MSDLIRHHLPASHHAVVNRESFLSLDECQDIARKLVQLAVGGGQLRTVVDSNWVGLARVGRNQLRENIDVRDTLVDLTRSIRGGAARTLFHGIDDAALEAGIRRAERWLRLQQQDSDEVFEPHLKMLEPDQKITTREEAERFVRENERLAGLEAMTQGAEADVPVPKLFFEHTYQLDAGQRADAVLQCLRPVIEAGMRAACTLLVKATGTAIIDTRGEGQYCPSTDAQFSVTVRSPDGNGSGWAGLNSHEWATIDADKLCRIALDKCLRSRNPVAFEPGRYTAVLEPQAVNDIAIGGVCGFNMQVILGGYGPYAKKSGTRLNERVIDERITVAQDPMDPITGYMPYGPMGTVSYPTTWIEKGILKNLSYERPYAVKVLGKNRGQPEASHLRVTGGDTPLEEMIATTQRGIYVTRFSDVSRVEVPGGSVIVRGITRDGTWLIEDGKITKPVKNFRVVESEVGLWNRIELVGPSVRVYNPTERGEVFGSPQWIWQPAAYRLIPSLKVRDFNFTALSDAI